MKGNICSITVCTAAVFPTYCKILKGREFLEFLSDTAISVCGENETFLGVKIILNRPCL